MSDDLSIPDPSFRGSRAGRYGTGPNYNRTRQGGMDSDTKRLMMFAGGLAGVLVALIGASAVVSHRPTTVPVITADARPVREKPANPGGMKIDQAENDVFSGGSDTSNPQLAAAAEAPDTRALQTQESAPPPPDVSQAPAAPPLAAASPPPSAPSAPSKPATAGVAPQAEKPVPALPTPFRPATGIENRSAKPSATATTENHAAADPHQSTASETRAAGQHQAMVQLAALTSEEAARAEWTQLAKKMPDLLKSRQPTFAKIERDGHIYWRVRTAGFADAVQAREFCDHVRAKGAGCSVADF